MSEQGAVNLGWGGVIPYLENDDDMFSQFYNFGYGDFVALPELLCPTAMEQSIEEDNSQLFLQGGGDWNPSFYFSQEERNVLGISPDYDYNNNSAVTTTTTTTTTSACLISSASNFSSFPPLSPSVSYNSQFEAESSVSVCPPPRSPLVMPTALTNTHTNLQKRAKKIAGKKIAEKRGQAQEEVVMFAVEGDGNALYDGYSWRKYGEKNIKHRDFPRSYYKCGHDGCNVKKHVERSSGNPAQTLLTYNGHHNHHPITIFSSNDGW